MRALKFLLTFTVASLPTLARAHVGIGDTTGVVHGFAHPLSGIDHILAMVAVGVIAAQLGGRALWAVPLSFAGMMVVGGALGMSGVALPLVETGIGLSVAVLGLLVALGLRPPVAATAGLVGFFAIFHGHAHGAEMPDTASGLGYALGFVAATAVLHALGIGLGLIVARLGASHGDRIIRAAGAGVAVAGVAILGGVV